MFETIVVGVDGRSGGRDALRLAQSMAGVDHGRMVAVRAVPDIHGGLSDLIPDAFVEGKQRAALKSELAAQHVSATARVLIDNSPAHALHLVAEHERAGLIVVGSTHHGRLGRAFVGDDALATLHGAGCPVAVATRGNLLPDAGIRRIGVGYDGGPESRHALALAHDLARHTGARLELLAIVETPIALPVDEPTEPPEPDWLPRYGEATQAMVDEALAALDVPASGTVALGLPADRLVELSRRADLVVVGSRAWGPIRRTLLGSTAARLVRGAACPLIVVPRGAATGAPGEREPDGGTALTAT